MFGRIRSLQKPVVKFFNSVVHCESDDVDSDTPSLVEQADAAIENQKLKLRTPLLYENLRNTISQGSVSTFDGFRCAVQKQVNLNTVVSHFYWLGSQKLPEPMYQYRVILPYDDKMVNVATDMDFNVEGEAKFPLAEKVVSTLSFAINEQQPHVNVDVDISEETAASRLQVSRGLSPKNGLETTVSLSTMQALTPALALGGKGKLVVGKGNIERSLGGIYSSEDTLWAAQWSKDFQLLYLRKVNPNRVHLATVLEITEEGEKTATVSAEYTLKQSKLHMSVNSKLEFSSSLETTVAPGVSFQLCADMAQLNKEYKYGYGITMS